MILVCGLHDEPVITHYLAYLSYYKHPFVFIDERELQKTIFLNLKITKKKYQGKIKFNNWSVNINQITGVYNRLGMLEDDTTIYHKNTQYKALEFFLNTFPKHICNRPYAIESNGSKGSQFKAIIEAGLNVPNSFLGFSGKKLLEFKEDTKEVIVKSSSSIRSIVKVATKETLNDIVDKQIIVPNQYQERLYGTNIRAHVIGNKVMACEMQSDVLDYRYTGAFGGTLNVIPIELPKKINLSCIRLNKILNLDFSGIDLFRDKNNNWYCFEINTCPGYSWFEEKSGLPISMTLTKYLLNHEI